MRGVAKILVITSRAVLIVAALSASLGGWLYFGYANMSCHTMFANATTACAWLATLASEHVMVAGRFMFPYLNRWHDQYDVMLIGGALTVSGALLVQIFTQVDKKRRRRRFGPFADVTGVSPIE